MTNAKDADTPAKHNILLVGPTGSGKTSQIWTLPGKKFVYIFDPNSLISLKGCDVDYEMFLPDTLEIDSTLKGFNKGSKDDRMPGSRIEPTTYIKWVEDMNERYDKGFFNDYKWLCIDSLTYLQRAVFDRQLYINNRYGKIEELADYRIVGSKLSDVFRPISSLPINIFVTGHIRDFQDEITRKITTELNLSGQAKTMVPLVMSNIWLARGASTEKQIKFEIQTRPDIRGLQCIRSSFRGLDMYHDVTIQNFDRATEYGIGKILQLNNQQEEDR